MPKDMMANFQLFQPTDIPNALELADRYGEDSWIIAGGQDSLDWFKDRAKQPRAVIDINGIEELNGIRETADGIEIGALTTLTEIESHALKGTGFEVLHQHIRLLQNTQNQLEILGILEVEHDRFFAPVEPDEVRTLAVDHAVVTASKVALGPLDLDDPRPGIGESARAERRGDRLLQGEDQNPVKGFHLARFRNWQKTDRMISIIR